MHTLLLNPTVVLNYIKAFLQGTLKTLYFSLYKFDYSAFLLASFTYENKLPLDINKESLSEDSWNFNAHFRDKRAKTSRVVIQVFLT